MCVSLRACSSIVVLGLCVAPTSPHTLVSAGGSWDFVTTHVSAFDADGRSPSGLKSVIPIMSGVIPAGFKYLLAGKSSQVRFLLQMGVCTACAQAAI